ncbi:MAG: hypothetical protein V1797_02905 [Pseudomonadota bacterium]
MEREPRHIILVDPAERLALKIGASTLYYRRLSLGALAAIEAQQARLLPGPAGPGEPPAWTLPPAALEAALMAHALLGWEGVTDPAGRPVEFCPAAAARLPGRARRIVLGRARKLHPPATANPEELT